MMVYNPKLIVQWSKGVIQRAAGNGVKVGRFIVAPGVEEAMLKQLATSGFDSQEDFDIVDRKFVLSGVEMVSDKRLPEERGLVLLICNGGKDAETFPTDETPKTAQVSA